MRQLPLHQGPQQQEAGNVIERREAPKQARTDRELINIHSIRLQMAEENVELAVWTPSSSALNTLSLGFSPMLYSFVLFSGA